MVQVTTQQRLMFLVAILVPILMAAQGQEPQRCTPSTIDVQQTNTGKNAGTLGTVFQVTVTNLCPCGVKAVFLQADGFTSSIPVDPQLFRPAGAAGYLLGDGQLIKSGDSVVFQYGWDHYFQMTPASMLTEC